MKEFAMYPIHYSISQNLEEQLYLYSCQGEVIKSMCRIDSFCIMLLPGLSLKVRWMLHKAIPLCIEL
jgi:hypothetical protein